MFYFCRYNRKNENWKFVTMVRMFYVFLYLFVHSVHFYSIVIIYKLKR